MGKCNALTPNPETLFGPEIGLNDEMRELAEAKEQHGKQPARPQLPPGKVLDKESGKIIDLFPVPPMAEEEEDGFSSYEDFLRSGYSQYANGEE